MATDILATDNPVSHEIKRAAAVVKTMYENGLHTVLSVFYKASSILATIPAKYVMFGRQIFQWVAKSEDVPSFHNGSRTSK